LNFGFDVMVRHAVSTSMFLSLCWVFGNLDPEQAIIGVELLSSVFFSTADRLPGILGGVGGANGDGPSASMAF